MKYQFNFAFDDRLIEKLGYEPKEQVILVIRAVMDAIRLAEKNRVIFITDDLEAKTLFETTVIGNGEFGCDDECIFIETPVINKKTDMSMWLEWSKGIDMQFSAMVINPPYSIGNKIISEVVKHLTKDGKAIVIQPLGQYKQQKLYEQIEQFELSDPKQFTDAVITENLNISVVTKGKQNKYTWQQLVLESCDQNFRKFYDWNIAHNRGIFMKRQDGKTPNDFNKATDFLETSRSYQAMSGGGFGNKGLGYNWNVLKVYAKVYNVHNGLIKLKNQREVNNFSKYWYNGTKGNSTCSRLILGAHADSGSPEYFFALPQIDWETIDQHPLWSTDVDAAVLDTMGLKWNNDKSKIIQK